MEVSQKPEFKLLPCIICTIGFNCYVAGYKVTYSLFKPNTDKQKPGVVVHKLNKKY